MLRAPRVRLALIVLALATIGASRAMAVTCPDFAAAVSYGVGTGPYSVAVGDLNGDGKLDLAVANQGSNTVSILLGNGNGTFATAVSYGVGASPYSVAIGDVNGDGKPDLVVANHDSNTVSILLGNGNGTFATAVNYGVGSNPFSVALGDVNGDGKLDLAVANLNSNDVSILLGNGNGTFGTAVSYGAGTYAASVALGDVNGDGKLDLAVANFMASTVSVLLGNGNGTFATAVNYGVGSGPISVAIGDVNGDDKPDLAVANLQNGSGGTVSVLLGNGSGTFATAVNYSVDSNPRSVALGDFNGDGKLDLAVANSISNTVSILRATFSGTFATADNCAAGSGASGVAFGDFNGDGKPDLVVANSSGTDVSILLNTSAPFTSPFTDDPLSPATAIKAVHVTELRSAINALRARHALSAFSFTDSLVSGSTPIRAAHFGELRLALEAVYDALGLAHPNYVDPSLAAGTVAIRRIHLRQIRDAERAAAEWLVLNASRSGTGSGTVTSAPAGITCGTDCTESYAPGTVVTLTATPAAGSTFGGWSGACTGTGPCQVTMAGDASVTATFTAIQTFTLTVTKGGTGAGGVTSSPAGISCGGDCQEAYFVGTSVTLTATASPGSYFVNWTGACSGSGACSLTMNADATVGATFNLVQPFTLTVTKGGSGTGSVTSSPAGIDCGGDCQEIYYTGTSVTLTASAPSGSYFANWTGACSGGGQCTVTMNADTTVGATFSTFTIDIDPVRGTVRMPNKYRTANWGVGGYQFTNYVAVPPGWSVGGYVGTNYVAVPPGWSVQGYIGTNYIAVPPGWSLGGAFPNSNNYVAIPPGWSEYHIFGGNSIVVPPGWSAGGSSGFNFALPPGWSTGGVFGSNYIGVPPGWAASNNNHFGMNYVSLAPGWTLGGQEFGLNSPTNYVALPPGLTLGGEFFGPNMVGLPPGWALGGSQFSANHVAYPTTAVTTLEVAFNDPGWIPWFQALKSHGVMSDSDIADVVIYVFVGGANTSRWGSYPRGWGWQGGAPAGQWP